MPNEWRAIMRSVSATASEEGMQHAVNPRFSLEGELQRRRGLEAATDLGAVNIINAWDPINGYQVLLFTAEGTLELVAL